MKTLLILRHAKAQPDAPHGDHARALTARGERNARTIGVKIRELVGTPGTIVTSDARRAHQTAELVAAATDFTAPLTVEPDVYGAGLDGLLALVRALPDAAASVVLVGHNPGFEELTTALAEAGGDEVILPTAGLAHLEFAAARWRNVRAGTGRLRAIYKPRELEA